MGMVYRHGVGQPARTITPTWEERTVTDFPIRNRHFVQMAFRYGVP